MSTPQRALRLLDTREPRICVLTSYQGPRIVPQHRQGGMGGSKRKHRTANLLWIDSIFNGLIESDPEWQLRARVYGVDVPSWADLEKVPVYYPHLAGWFRLVGDERIPLTVGQANEAMFDVYGAKYFEDLARVEGATQLAAARIRGWS